MDKIHLFSGVLREIPEIYKSKYFLGAILVNIVCMFLSPESEIYLYLKTGIVVLLTLQLILVENFFTNIYNQEYQECLTSGLTILLLFQVVVSTLML
jgi:hypothetical protein